MGACAQELPPVYFNHTTIYVTPETYDALKASALMQGEFSGSAETTTHDNGGARVYTGFYIFGIHTYLEIFKAGPNSIAEGIVPAGRISLGMWIDRRSQLPVLRDRLGIAEIQTRLDAQNAPWYDRLSLTSEKGLRTWVQADYPDGKTREQTLLRTVYEPDRLFHDVTAYTVTASILERERLLRWFQAYGYKIHEDGEKRIAMGPDFTFTMLPEPANGVRTAVIEMSLNREKTGEQTYKIGDSELKFNKDRATLTFRFPKTTDR